MLPEPLQALAAYRQFLCWTLTNDVPPRKLPVSPYTGYVCSAHDPAAWADADTAIAFAAAHGYGVAFSFQESDPFFFIDVDKAFDGQEWSQLAQQMCAFFPGAAIEVSSSKTGLHIIGRYTQEPTHGCSYRDSQGKKVLEFYTRERFVALTFTNIAGDAGTDHTNMLHSVASHYFPATAGTGADGDWLADWTEAPVAAWNGPTDDNELIRRALLSRSAAGTFGGGASFRDLWEGNEEVILRVYGGDRSTVDAALAQHLAFWTGNDCARIERLMRQSAIYREKWDRGDGEEYLRRTINGRTGATRRQNDFLHDKTPASPSAPAVVDPGTPAGPIQAQDISGSTYLNIDAQREFFKGCVYVRDVHKIYVPDGDMLKSEQFNVNYGGYTFALDRGNERTTKYAWDAFTQSQALKFPKSHATCFRPECTPGALLEEEGRILLNVYIPIQTKCVAGDPGLFLHHLEKLFPMAGDRHILLTYIAACIQRPGAKFQWWPVLQGVEGDGKTLILRVISHCIGHRYTHLPNADDIARSGGKFNSWLRNKLFIGMEEVYVADRRDFLEIFKPNVTNDRLQIEGKGIDQVMGDNRANGMIFTNHHDGVPVTVDTRRYPIFYSAMQSAEDLAAAGMDNVYFNRIYDWLKGEGEYAHCGVYYGYSIMNSFFRTYQLDPSVNLMGRAPQTSSTKTAIKHSWGTVEQEIDEAVNRGDIGFKGGWISSTQLDVLLERRCKNIKLSQAKRREVLKHLGYYWHPVLSEGRVDNIVMPDGNKPRLFITKGHPSLGLITASEVAHAYTTAQLT